MMVKKMIKIKALPKRFVISVFYLAFAFFANDKIYGSNSVYNLPSNDDSDLQTKFNLAQKSSSKKSNKIPIKKKIISGQGKIRTSGDRTMIDFDEATISGERKTPIGSIINQKESNKKYDFIKIRRRWHPEMKSSTRNLDKLKN